MPRKSPPPIIFADELLKLPPEEAIVSCDLHLRRVGERRFSIENAGRLLLRLADGSRALNHPQTGTHLLATAEAAQVELDQRQWPVHALQPNETQQLGRLGIDPQHTFPPFMYWLPQFSRFYGNAGQASEPQPFPGVRQCAIRDSYLYPRITDMDNSSLKALSTLFSLPFRQGALPGLPNNPLVQVGGQLRSLQTTPPR